MNAAKAAPIRAKRKDYDDAELVLQLAQGRRTMGEIARELGTSPDLLRKIAAGKRRPHLQPLIRRARARIQRHLRRRIRRRAAAAFRRHLKIMGTGTPPMARRSREFLLTRLVQPLTEGTGP